MATRTFVNQAQVEEGLQILKSQGPMALSKKLGELLEARLSAHPNWRLSKPYKLGSWSRGELSAKSDIDLLFVGEEHHVQELVNDLQKEGIKIRYRVPADMNDWTVNVEAFDVLALISAVPFYSEDLAALTRQQELILKRGLKYKKQLFRTMMKERNERAVRYDSIATYLEPNLKYGPGGLRDLEQGLMIHALFADRFDHAKVLKKLHGLKIELMKIRHFLHLSGANDVLVSGLQHEAAGFLNFENTHSFMSTLSRQLADVSFYADLIAEIAQSPQKDIAEIDNFDQAVRLLHAKPTLQTQYQIRSQKIDVGAKKKLGAVFMRYFNTKMSDGFLQGLFRSKILSVAIHNLDRLRGHVQHDQYHRYSVDAHTLQAVREVLRVKARPQRLGRLSKVVNKLTPADWDVLLWSALYHDLGKGLKGDHSTVGADIVKRDFIDFGLSLELTRQVIWMVQNHLLLSGAAFRQNPHAAKTWSELFSRGVKGARLLRLAVFTAIDIKATNPDAWNDWKERLLFELTQSMQSPKANSLSELLEVAEKKKVRLDRAFIENLDSRVIESVSKTVLLKDYIEATKAKESLPPLIVRNKKNEIWVRLHERKDQPGLFLAFTKLLHSLGLSVQEAFVQTYEDIGAYDWFKVKSSKSLPQLRTMLKNSAPLTAKGVENLSLDVVCFQNIELVSQDEGSAILSFRGKDQRGALLAAAHALYNLNLEIRSAKVHTWGRQIDDVFTVRKQGAIEGAVKKLGDRLVKALETS